VSTLWRWMRRGCKARNGQTIRLEHRRVGGTLTTTRADLERFFCALAAADLESFKAHDAAPLQALRTVAAPPKPFSDSVRRAQIERARRVLDEAGI
jgi:hypothetical protein